MTTRKRTHATERVDTVNRPSRLGQLLGACLLAAVLATATWSAATSPAQPPAKPIPTTDHGTGVTP